MSTDVDKNINPESYFDDEDPHFDNDARLILTQYSGIPEPSLVPHVRAIRDKAFKLFPYPCIGLYSFLAFTIAKSPQYPEILRRVKQGETLLDLGCCFGQDLRRLVFDGAPASGLTGGELERGFLDLGYEFLLDRGRFCVPLLAGDFFGPIPGLEKGSFDMVHAAFFFHLFSWDEQVQAVAKALQLLKPKKGPMLFGRQVRVEEAGAIRHPDSRSGEMYWHNVESWKGLVALVSRQVGVEVDCEVVCYEGGNQRSTDAVEMMRFVVVLR
ncbi:hypothetical protein LTR33_008612 [Friedmanniomyces endolithicus]|nr:hypothetical protein LTR33_008612 [Friedmanniomyces endolithicus]